MRRLCLGIFLFPFLLVAQDGKKDAAFASGGYVNMNLSAGDAEVIGTDEEKITVTYDTEGRDKKVTVDLSIAGKNAQVRVDGPNNQFHYQIYIPRRSNIRIRMSAGALEVRDIRGEKDVELRAGDLTIKIGDPRDYGPVHASVTMGGLDAAPFNKSKGGMGRSFKLQGDGSYRLHAHVFTGQLTLE